MKIKQIALSWFRGAGQEATLDTELKSVVVYGANGSGKSSFTDAIEYVLREGKVGHLAHEYSGRRHKRGVRNTHAPSDAPTQISIEFEGGQTLCATLTPQGDLAFNPSDFAQVVQKWQLKHTILRQDEVAEFIHSTKGDKYSVLLPLFGLESLETAARNLRQLHRRVEQKSKLADLQRDAQRYRQQASFYFPDCSQDQVYNALAELASRYSVQMRDEPAELVTALSASIRSRINSLQPEQRRCQVLNEIKTERLDEKFNLIISAEKSAAGVLDELLDRRIKVLESTGRFIKGLGPSEQVDCPACGRPIRREELEKHVEQELKALRKARAARDKVQEARRDFAMSAQRVINSLGKDEVSAWLNEPHQKELKQALVDIMKLDLQVYELGWSDKEQELLARLLRALAPAVDAALRVAPPQIQQLLEDSKRIEAAEMVLEMTRIERKVRRIEDLLHLLAKGESAIREAIGDRVRSTIHRISGEVQRLWAKLHPNEPIENVELYIPEDAEKGIDICLKFYEVEQPSPRLTLSEGHRNSLGLSIFLALAKLQAATDRPIILDDVVSSFDREHRGMLTEILTEEFSDRQVIDFTHDREWYRELTTMLPQNNWKFMVLRPFEDPVVGLRWSESRHTLDDARALLKDHPEAAGNRARAMMDADLAWVAEKLKIPMPYLRGDNNDKRTGLQFLQRLIPEADKRLRKRNDVPRSEYERYGAAIDDLRKAKDLLQAWANRGSHSGSLVPSEASKLIDVCEAALSCFYCDGCGKPVWKLEDKGLKRVQCECGSLQWRYG